jgi:hypothetical protein
MEKMGCQFFKDDMTFPLSKEQIDNVALRISYDMEYFSRHPNGTFKKILYTIVLNWFNEYDYHHGKEYLKKHQNVDSTTLAPFRKIMN